MPVNEIKISPNFQKKTFRAILSIVLFISVYIILIIFAVALTVFCGFVGLMLLSSHISFMSIMLSIGAVSMGILVMIFLIKFIFKEHTIDRSHLIEITETQEPKLFAFINTIVEEVKTDFPKKIYVSADVNASVFYDSSFWSMFLPVKKNLMIGVGLVNAVTYDEFKAILAHEFGHFSQKTMKVGSYVYNVNQIIFNMLNDNDSYQDLAQRWASVNNYFALFVMLAVKIVKAIQWILGKIYGIVNISYMALSREMEFHADEVAAHVAGSKSLITSLLRLDLANQSYQTVLDYYGRKIGDGVKSKNIYPQHQFVLNFLAQKSQLPIENNLPQVSLDDLSRYNKSKLVIKDQWASHPSTPDRVEQLEKLNIPTTSSNTASATALFSNILELQKKVTDNIFSNVTYEKQVRFQEKEAFAKEFVAEYQGEAYNDLFNCYYDNKNPNTFDIQEIVHQIDKYATKKAADLFSRESVDTVYLEIALENDLQIVRQIADKTYKIKTFDYDGDRYSNKNCKNLIPNLENELEALKQKITENDKAIFGHFYSVAQKQGKEADLVTQYKALFDIKKVYEQKVQYLINMNNVTAFMHQTTPNEVIQSNITAMTETEETFKNDIKSILNDAAFNATLTAEMRAIFTQYTSKYWIYFTKMSYQDDALNLLFSAMQLYQKLLVQTYLDTKKSVLDFQALLEISSLRLQPNA